MSHSDLRAGRLGVRAGPEWKAQEPRSGRYPGRWKFCFTCLVTGKGHWLAIHVTSAPEGVSMAPGYGVDDLKF